MHEKLIAKAKDLFIKKITDHGDDPWSLILHTNEAEKWAEKILQEFPDIDQDTIYLTLWLHDIGHYPITKTDHAISSEIIAKKFLIKEGADKDLVEKVLHSIRSHRNRDVVPQTPEAKLFAALDSISHFTYAPYIDMMRDGRGKEGMAKLERDYRDIQLFPELKKELTPLYSAWKKLLQEVDKLQLYN